MARLVRFKGKGPILIGNPPIAICNCGLSKTFPYCSGAHIKTVLEEDDETVIYDKRGNLIGIIKSIKLKTGEEIKPDTIYTQPEQIQQHSDI